MFRDWIPDITVASSLEMIHTIVSLSHDSLTNNIVMPGNKDKNTIHRFVDRFLEYLISMLK